MNGNDKEQVINQESAPYAYQSFLLNMPEKTQPKKEISDLNSLDGFIQQIGV
jgi:hypothetical protein